MAAERSSLGTRRTSVPSSRRRTTTSCTVGAGSSPCAISVETAQSHLDPATLRPLRGTGIALGVLDLSTPEVETPETVADRVRRALDHVDVGKLLLSSDCGLKYLPRASAAGKMRALADAAAILRSEL